MTKNLFRIHGGKYYLANWIIQKLPPHDKYVEGCLGAGTVFYNKPHVESTLYETDRGIYLIHSHLSYLAASIGHLECKREIFDEFKSKVPQNDQEEALREYILRKMSRVGQKKYFSESTRLRGGRPEHINSWENSKDLSHFIGRKATIINGDFFQHKFQPDELIYVDPPYVHSTRSTRREYGPHEWDDKKHEELVSLAKSSPGMWFISGYPNEIYDGLGWTRHDKCMPNHASQSKQKSKRIESLWTNM